MASNNLDKLVRQGNSDERFVCLGVLEFSNKESKSNHLIAQGVHHVS